MLMWILILKGDACLGNIRWNLGEEIEEEECQIQKDRQGYLYDFDPLKEHPKIMPCPWASVSKTKIE